MGSKINIHHDLANIIENPQYGVGEPYCIDRALFKLDSYETAKFVVEHMNDAVVLDYTQDVLELGISSVKIDALYPDINYA